MGEDKGKKLKAIEVEEEENNVTLHDEELVLSIEKLQQVQDELEKINEQASEKVLEVERKFNEIRKPAYDKRNEIIKAIPHFWLIAFVSHPALNELLTEEDQKIFKYLHDLEVEESKDMKSGYSITFTFNPNPYFEDTKVSKTFTYLEGITKITATPIKWKEGMGIPNVLDEEKKGNKRAHVQQSFFTWFSGSEHKAEIFEIQDEVADIIKEDLWSNPLTYFNNDDDEEELEMDDEDEDEENGGDGSEDDDDENDDDEDEDDDED